VWGTLTDRIVQIVIALIERIKNAAPPRLIGDNGRERATIR